MIPNKAMYVKAVEMLGESVVDFHERFETEADEKGFHDLGLLTEELGEFARAVNRGDRQDALREAADVAYVALGILALAGFAGEYEVLSVAGKNNSKTKYTHYRHPETRKITRIEDANG